MDTNQSNGVESTPQTTSTTTTTTTTSTGSPTSGGESWGTNTTISTLEDLRKKAPKVYEAMIQGIGMNMVNKMRRDQEHLKQIMREGNRVFDK